MASVYQLEIPMESTTTSANVENIAVFAEIQKYIICFFSSKEAQAFPPNFYNILLLLQL